MITQTREKYGVNVAVDGCTLAIITHETDLEALARFVALCEKEDQALSSIGLLYEIKRKWNMDHPGEGKDWPIFRVKEQRVKALLHQAGIVDS